LRLRAKLRTTPLPTDSKTGRARKKTAARVAASRVISPGKVPVLFHTAAKDGSPKNRPVNTPVLARADILPGKTRTGPAVITEYSATTVVLPGKKFWVDTAENLVIKIR